MFLARPSLKVELLDQRLCESLVLVDNGEDSFKWKDSFTSSHDCRSDLVCCSTNTASCQFLKNIFSCSISCVVASHHDFHFRFPDTDQIEHLFIGLWVFWISKSDSLFLFFPILC